MQANGRRDWTFSLLTDRDGNYAFWAPDESNPYTVIASKDGWISQTKTVRIRKGRTTTVDFDLNRLNC